MSHAHTMESFWRAFGQGDFDHIEAKLAQPEIEFVMPGAPELRGMQAVRGLWEAWRAAFPDMRQETAHAIENADTYAAETRFVATHTGTLRSPQGEVPPTGKVVRWQSADVVRFKDGRIASWHVYHDQLPLLAQLGLMGGAPTG